MYMTIISSISGKRRNSGTKYFQTKMRRAVATSSECSVCIFLSIVNLTLHVHPRAQESDIFLAVPVGEDDLHGYTLLDLHEVAGRVVLRDDRILRARGVRQTFHFTVIHYPRDRIHLVLTGMPSRILAVCVSL